MNNPSLLPDCSHCASLCCVALAFDKSDKFAIDKDAGAPCPNLATNGLCKIHDKLEERGFGGCIQFNCFGAGQRVTQEVFGGKSWQQNISLLQPMSDAFRVMRQIHDLLQLLEVAAKLPLSKEDKHHHLSLVQTLTPSPHWTRDSLKEFESGPTPEKAKSFFASLGNYVTREKKG